MDSAHATFIVRDAELTGAEITGLLGLQPSWVSERGQPVSRRNPGGPVREHTTWALSSGLPDSEVLHFSRCSTSYPRPARRSASCSSTAVTCACPAW